MVVWLTKENTMLKNYIKLAFKVLLRKKFFTIISLFGISFTILVLLVTASFLDHAINPGEPQTFSDRTLIAAKISGRDSTHSSNWRSGIGYGFIKKYATKLKTPELTTFISGTFSYNTYINGNKFNLTYKYTDANFWQAFNFEFIKGKPYSNSDFNSANKFAVISENTAEIYFGSIDVVGKVIDISGEIYRVAGVVKNISVAHSVLYTDIWVPATTNPGLRESLFGEYKFIVIARDKNDFSEIKKEYWQLVKEAVPEAVNTLNLHELKSELVSTIDILFPETRNDSEMFEFNSSKASQYIEEKEHSLFATAASITAILIFVFMLLPSINLININLSRIVERSSEIGVRKAFGASGNVLVGQFLTENIILTFIGGVISLALSYIVLDIINSSDLFVFINLTISYKVFISGIVMCFIFGILSGVYPAYRMSRMHPVEALKGDEK